MSTLLVISFCAAVGFYAVTLIMNFARSARGSRSSPAGAEIPKSPIAEEQTERDWHEVLGISAGASESEIKAAYRERAREYHPDRVAGLAFEFRTTAERRMKEINAAYAKALRRT